MKPSFVLFLNHELHLIVSREERHGRSGLMTHLARKSGLGVLSFWRFCQSWGVGGWQLVLLGFIRAPERVHMAHSVDTAHTSRMCEPVERLLSQALTGTDGRMRGLQTLIAHLCVTLLCCWLLALSPGCC